MKEQLLGFMVNVAPWVALVLYVIALVIAATTGLMSLGSTRAYACFGIAVGHVPLIDVVFLRTSLYTHVHSYLCIAWTLTPYFFLAVPPLLVWMVAQQKKTSRSYWLCVCFSCLAASSLLAFLGFAIGINMLSAV